MGWGGVETVSNTVGEYVWTIGNMVVGRLVGGPTQVVREPLQGIQWWAVACE